jgi:hypothetical protein
MNPIIEKTNFLKKMLKIETETKIETKMKNEFFHSPAFMSSPKASDLPLPPEDFFL